MSPESPVAPDVCVKPGDPTNPVADGAIAEGRTKVGAELADGLIAVRGTSTPVGVGDDVGDTDGDKDPPE